jgi:hypothetical protein
MFFDETRYLETDKNGFFKKNRPWPNRTWKDTNVGFSSRLGGIRFLKKRSLNHQTGKTCQE